MSQVSELSDVLQELLDKRDQLAAERKVLQERGAYVDALVDSLNAEDATLKQSERDNAARLRDVRRDLKEAARDFELGQKQQAQEFAKEAKDLRQRLDQEDPLPDKKK